MSDANMATSTKQLIVSIVIVGVMLAAADQVGRSFLSSVLDDKIDSFEEKFKVQFAHIEKDILELSGGQRALNLRFPALTERVAHIEGYLRFNSPEKRDRAEQAPLKPEADRG